MIQKGYDGNQEEISETYLKILKNNLILHKVYFCYLQVQQFIFCGYFKSFRQFDENNCLIYKDNLLTLSQREIYKKKINSLMIVWSWNGVDLPIFLLVLISILGELEFFLKPLACLLVLQFFFTMTYHRIQKLRLSYG